MIDTLAPAIETRHLRKEFGSKSAVEDLTLRVERGEVFGFLGPNGAGKTTSVKMLLGLITPSGGEGRLFGEPLGDAEVRSLVGFLPEHFRFHDWLTAREFMALHANLYHIPREKAEGRIADLLDLVGLIPHASKKLRTFSKGMLQRIGLAQALLNDPALVILDEPTSGLDPVGRRLVRDIISELRQNGTTVFLNSHLLSEVEITCDRVAFIKHGKVIRISPLKTLMEGELSVEIRVKRLQPEMLDGLRRWGRNLRRDGELLTMILEKEKDLPEVNSYLVQIGAEVYALRPQHISLEDMFIEVVGMDGGL
jgi:ABC-2 type transport system ATP-binding protein